MVEIAPVAVLKDSTPYNSTSLTNENSTIDLSCNEVPIKPSHSAKQRTSKSKRIQLTKGRKTCAPVDYAKGETFQLSQKLVRQIEKRKKLQTNGHQKGRKESLVSQRKASKEENDYSEVQNGNYSSKHPQDSKSKCHSLPFNLI